MIKLIRFGGFRWTVAWLPLGVAILSVATLSLGLSASITVFSVLDAVVLRPLPYSEPEAIVTLSSVIVRPDTEIELGLDDLQVELVRQHSQSIEAVGNYQLHEVELTGGSLPSKVKAAVISPSILEILRVDPIEGRWFSSDEERPGADTVIVSQGVWLTRLGSRSLRNEQVLLEVGHRRRRVVGVMPPGFGFPDGSVGVWLPMPHNPTLSGYSAQTLGRLRSGVSVIQAEAELRSLLAEARPRVVSLREFLTGETDVPLTLAFLATLMILGAITISFLGVFALTLEDHRDELVLRFWLGASRMRMGLWLVGRWLPILGLTALLSMAAAAWEIALAPSAIPFEINRLTSAAVNARSVFLVVAWLAVAFGALAAVVAFRMPSGREASSGRMLVPRITATRKSGRPLRFVPALQLAFGTAIVYTSLLFIQSFLRLQAFDLGFEPSGVLSAQIALPQARYGGVPQRLQAYREALDEIRSIPGVQYCALSTALPFVGKGESTIRSDAPGFPVEAPVVNVLDVMGDYDRTMGLRLVAGRTFGERDSHPGSKPVVIVNEKLVNLYLPDGALGRHLGGVGALQYEIVGVVGDVHHFGPNQTPQPEIYFPLQKSPNLEIPLFEFESLYLVVRSSVQSRHLVGLLQEAAARVDPKIHIVDPQPMESRIWGSRVEPAFWTSLMTGAGAVAMLVIFASVFASMGLLVTQRAREFAVRMALGATRGQVASYIFRRSLEILVPGGVLGLLLGLGLGGMARALLFGVAPLNAWTVFGCVAMVTMVACVAVYLPARRLVLIRPSELLRS